MNTSVRSILYMFVLTLVFTTAVSLVKVVNDSRIERNQLIKLQRVILKVMDIPVAKNTSDEELLSLFNARVRPLTVKDKTIYAGFEEDGQTIKAYAFPVGGPGFWGPIYGMAAISPQADRLVGIAFYKHQETPGLGARMTEPWFTDQFKGLALGSVKKGDKLFRLIPEGTSSAPNELDAITGASRTSAAVEAFLNRDLENFIREYKKALQDKLAKG